MQMFFKEFIFRSVSAILFDRSLFITVWGILIEGFNMRTICVILFYIWFRGSDVVQRFFYFLALAAILFDKGKPFGQFGRGPFKRNICAKLF